MNTVQPWSGVKPGDRIALNRGLTPAFPGTPVHTWRPVLDVEHLPYGGVRLTVAFTLEPVTMTAPGDRLALVETPDPPLCDSTDHDGAHVPATVRRGERWLCAWHADGVSPARLGRW